MHIATQETQEIVVWRKNQVEFKEERYCKFFLQNLEKTEVFIILSLPWRTKKLVRHQKSQRTSTLKPNEEIKTFYHELWL